VLGPYEYGLNIVLYELLWVYDEGHRKKLSEELSEFDDSSSQEDLQDDNSVEENAANFEELPGAYNEAEDDGPGPGPTTEALKLNETRSQNKIEDVWEKKHSRPAERRPTLLLFGVRGCGKTRRVFDYLKSNFGFYILPGCKLPDDRIGQDDTQHWYSTVEQVEMIPKKGEGPMYLIRNLIEIFVGLKFRLFKNFCKAAKAKQRSDPELYRFWLRHQIDAKGLPMTCSAMFEVAKLLKPRVILPNIGYKLGPKEGNEAFFPYWMPERFYYCFDEIQTDFENLNLYKEEPLQFMHIAILNMFYSSQCPGYEYSWTTVYSGTALRLKDINPSAASKLENVKTRIEMEELKRTMMIDFPNVTDFGRSWRMLVQHTRRLLMEMIRLVQDNVSQIGLIETSARPCSAVSEALRQYCKDSRIETQDVMEIMKLLREQKDEIIRHGTPLRGRYLWSSKYMQLNLVDAIHQHFGPGKSTLKGGNKIPNPKAHSLHIQIEVIQALKLNLDRLRTENAQLYQSICWLAIRADLLNKPTSFAQNGAAELVALDFAMAESDWTEDHDGAVVIKEPLAIRAVLEHLNSNAEGQKELQRQMNHWLFTSQDNANVLGENSEYYLAYVSPMLHYPVSLIV
jgi:hypothetical protein